jgi:diguanylate cyclase (GGDEF)-like protein
MRAQDQNRISEQETELSPALRHRSWRIASDLVSTGRFRWAWRILVVLFFVLPTMMLMILNIRNYQQQATLAVMKAKELQAILAATIVTEKTRSQFELAASFATRPLLVSYVEQGLWQDAIHVLDGVREQYPGIDRIVLLDLDGVIQADSPAAGVIGESRASTEWHRTFARTRQPTLSGAYLRSGEPRTLVVSEVLPIVSRRDPGDPASPKIIGTLQIQLKLERLHGWTDIDVGARGAVYIVDQHGHLVRHSQRKQVSEILDYSSVEIVRKALAGQNGVELNHNPVDQEWHVAAYRALPQHGWAVVVTQAAQAAYAGIDENLRGYYVIYACITILSWLLALAVLHIMIMHRRAEDAQRSMAILDELTGLANRRGFRSLAALHLATADRLGQQLFLAYIDLNRMKDINDRLGHKLGDLALVDTAEILQATFRDIDVKARLGGDEFVVLGVVKDGFSTEAIHERLHACTSEYLALHRRPYELSFSTGIAIRDPESPCDLDDLLEGADRRMYESKSKRRDQVSKAEMLSVSARYAATKN